jgi:hypothetical protein
LAGRIFPHARATGDLRRSFRNACGVNQAILFACFLSLTACGGGSGSGGNGGGFEVFNPSAPGSDFVRATTTSEQDALLLEWWNVLIAPICWDSSFVGDPTIGGTPASVSQYQFHSNYQYRHVGFSTFFGAIFFHDIGRYQGYTTAIVETWTGDVEAIAVIDGNTIVHVLKNPSGVPFYVAYGTVGAGGGACL